MGEEATTLRRGIRILAALGEEHAVERDGLGVVEVADLLHVDKSQASRTLKTLAEHGFVERDPDTRAYNLGWRIYTSAALVSRRRLLRLAPPLLRRVVDAVGERAHLSVLDGASVLTLLSESPPRVVQAVGWVGRLVPVHTTSSGRALLIDHDPQELRSLLAVAPLPEGAPDVEELARRVRAARGQGYAVARDEFEPGLMGVAAPVRRFDGHIVAALNLSGPTARLERAAESAIAEVCGAARELSAQLASRPGARVASPATDAATPSPVPTARSTYG